jgi:hypothetical protein
VRKVRRAGAPYEGRRPSYLVVKTLRSRFLVIVRSLKGKRREGRFRERDLESRPGGGRALETESPREQGSRPGLNIRGQSGTRLMMRGKPSKHRIEAEEVFI